MIIEQYIFLLSIIKIYRVLFHVDLTSKHLLREKKPLKQETIGPRNSPTTGSENLCCFLINRDPVRKCKPYVLMPDICGYTY
jgi:hypothetical protein